LRKMASCDGMVVLLEGRFTGRKELQDKITKNGGRVVKSISSKVTHIVNGDNQSAKPRSTVNTKAVSITASNFEEIIANKFNRTRDKENENPGMLQKSGTKRKNAEKGLKEVSNTKKLKVESEVIEKHEKQKVENIAVELPTEKVAEIKEPIKLNLDKLLPEFLIPERKASKRVREPPNYTGVFVLSKGVVNRAEVIFQIESNGGTLAKAVSKNVDYMICARGEDKKSRCRKAVAQNINLVYEDTILAQDPLVCVKINYEDYENVEDPNITNQTPQILKNLRRTSFLFTPAKKTSESSLH